MISGLVEHDGQFSLAVHVANAHDNELVAFRVHGLTGKSISAAYDELMLMAVGCRTTRPLLHVWHSPSKHYSAEDWDRNRAAFEREMDLEGHPHIEIYHTKFGAGGRTASHVHRIYLRLRIDGTAVRTSHSAARLEKVSRISEYENVESFASGCCNRSVIARLQEEGRPGIADAMIAAGLDQQTARSAPTRSERAASERARDLAADEVWRRAHDAWRRADSGPAFRAALADAGLRIANGRKCPVVVAPGGTVHPLLRAINQGAGDRDDRIRKADLDARLVGLDLPDADDLVAVPGHDAGVFAMTGGTRVGVTENPTTPFLDEDGRAPDLPVAADIDELAPAHELPSDLSREQEEALAKLSDAFHHAAAERARAARETIEAEVDGEARKRRENQLADRIRQEEAEWDQPAIGVPGWRDVYKAELAGLPPQYGPRLKWVQRLDDTGSIATLKSGTRVTFTPSHARADRTTSDTVAVMIAHARERGWSQITISGGSADWQNAVARSAVRAGIEMVDEHLLAVAEDERILIGRRDLIMRWRDARKSVEEARRSGENPVEAGRAWREALAALDQNPETLQLVGDERLREILHADLEIYRRHRTGRHEPPPDPPPR